MSDMDTVWCCWFQGLDNAPEIVKCCVNSIKQLGRKMVLLTEYNVRDYVFLPDYIWIKYREGTILPAHLSDLVRLELLTTRDGIWIDATTWISGTEHILPILDEKPIFMYRSGQVNEHIVFDNWLMQAKVFCKIFETTKEMLLEYWRRESSARNYFLMHIFMTIACIKIRKNIVLCRCLAMSLVMCFNTIC